MHKKFIILSMGLMLLALTFIAMVFTFRYEVDEYYEDKYHADVMKEELHDQINFLHTQLARPEAELNVKVLQTYDEKYGINIQENTKLTSDLLPGRIKSSLQNEMGKKQQQLETLEKQGLLSYIPEWPLLILGALSIIATRIINYLMDLIFCFIRKAKDSNH